MREFFYNLYCTIPSESLSPCYICAKGKKAAALDGQGYIEDVWGFASELDEWINNLEGRLAYLPHCYNFTVTPRNQTSTKKDFVNGTTALWCDIDGILCKDWKRANLEKLNKTLPPSAIIDSGWGTHLYWFLDSYILFDISNNNKRDVEKCNKFLAWFLEGDNQTADVSHLMRLPGSMNCKTHPYKNTEIYLQEVRYDFDEIKKTINSSITKYISWLEKNAPASARLTELKMIATEEAERNTTKERTFKISMSADKLYNKLRNSSAQCALLNTAFNNPTGLKYEDWFSLGAALAKVLPEETALDVFLKISLPGNTRPNPVENITEYFKGILKSSYNPYNCHKLDSGKFCQLCKEGKCKSLFNLFSKISAATESP